MTVYVFDTASDIDEQVVLGADQLGYSTAAGFKKGDGATTWANLPSLPNYAPSTAIGPFTAAPSTATSTGTTGQVVFDATNLYVCIATNTWVRATLATW